jgi:ABC-type oligopeptide transport system ATPase subunit
LFVALDLGVGRRVSDRIIVMYLGKLMEISPAEELYTTPIHPYTFAARDPDPRPLREPRAATDDAYRCRRSAADRIPNTRTATRRR